MAEHLLHRAEVGTAFHQVGGEGMPERMRADLGGDPGLYGQPLHQFEHPYPGEGGSPRVQENDVLRLILVLRILACERKTMQLKP